jgi:hypothetical protein
VGSTTTGRFDDYRGRRGARKGGRQGGGGAGEQEGGDVCEQTIDKARLEEVATSPYFEAHRDVPPAGTPVRVQKRLVGGRVAVAAGRKVVGYLGTQFNYLVRCMEQGHTYTGAVIASAGGRLPQVVVRLEPGR